MKLQKIFSNRNIILTMTVLFLSWLLFFDQNSYVDLRDLESKIEELKSERDFYIHKIAADSNVINNIKDSAFLEKYARENFFFIQPGETMYLMEIDTIRQDDIFR